MYWAARQQLHDLQQQRCEITLLMDQNRSDRHVMLQQLEAGDRRYRALQEEDNSIQTRIGEAAEKVRQARRRAVVPQKRELKMMLYLYQ